MTGDETPPPIPRASAASWHARLPFFYGWLMLPIITLIQIATAPGQTFGVAVFNPYLSAALSLSSTELSGAYMAGTLLAALPMTWTGALMDRHGPRKTLVGVVLLFGLTCLGMSQVSGLFTLFLVFLCLRLLGQGAMGLLAGATLAMWFNRRLGLAGGISNLGAAAAMGATPALGLWLIHSYGWRWAYAILGLTVWLLLLPLLGLFFRNRPENIGQQPDGGPDHAGSKHQKTAADQRAFTLSAALRTRTYWIVTAITASWSMIGTGIHFHAVPIYLARGLGETDAVAMFSIFAAVMAATRLGGGLLVDRAPLNLIIAAAMTCKTISLMLLNQLEAGWTAMLFPVSFALSSGLWMGVHQTLWVRYYGRAHLGKILGAATTVGVASSSFGPFAMGLAYDFFGGYGQIIWGFAVLAVPLALFGLLATTPVLPPRDN